VLVHELGRGAIAGVLVHEVGRVVVAGVQVYELGRGAIARAASRCRPGRARARGEQRSCGARVLDLLADPTSHN